MVTNPQAREESTGRTPSGRPWWTTRAPDGPGLIRITIATITSVLALTALAGLTELTDHVWLIPPMAASMALVMGAPQLPLSQPRNVVGGQTVSAAVGVAVGALGDSVWLGALAGGIALGAMMLLRMPHSPAAATAIIGVSTNGDWWIFIVLAAVSSAILVLIGIIGNRANSAKYPIYVW